MGRLKSVAETLPSLEVVYLNRAFRAFGIGGFVELGTGANYNSWVVHIQNPQDESTARSAVTEVCQRLGIPAKSVVIVQDSTTQMAGAGMNILKKALRLFSQAQDRTNGAYSTVQSQMSTLISSIDGLDPSSLSAEQKRDLEVFTNRVLVPRIWKIVRP